MAEDEEDAYVCKEQITVVAYKPKYLNSKLIFVPILSELNYLVRAYRCSYVLIRGKVPKYTNFLKNFWGIINGPFAPT